MLWSIVQPVDAHVDTSDVCMNDVPVSIHSVEKSVQLAVIDVPLGTVVFTGTVDTSQTASPD